MDHLLKKEEMHNFQSCYIIEVRYSAICNFYHFIPVAGITLS